jgi:hypothetical protein
VVETAWQGEEKSSIDDGIILGLYLFDRLYEDLDPLKDPGYGR